ncbi:STAS domain-containing protein [Pelagicoccus sp. SDUM812005]|uniref:STAS domain-containing protein n=1 Tax=Pelagicoccus sp. SDUM812005 TaxID=3041257 RepID=UPI00280F4F71|nr:STAS domain-containing protein [Pelagicoccus sp. SDUM812005]MDQ8181258.1 STAS domain-containing protein [Pelagicoccus sp. SDUM812005]
MNPTTHSYKADGDIVSTNASQHWTRLESAIQNVSENELLEVDLRAANMVDSVGLNVIVKTIKTVDARKARVRLLIGSKSLKRICTFTRLDQKAEIVGP